MAAFKIHVGLRLKHKYANETAEIVKIGEVFRRGVRFPFKTVVTLRYGNGHPDGSMDLSALRSNWKPE